MSSSVFFRFKSQKEPSRIAFDGTGLSVFELKRDIIAANKLGDGTDFELVISAEDTNEEYDDDTAIVPRSTTVIARRLPAAKAGRGGAARYVSGKMPQSSKSSHRVEAPISKSANPIKPINGLHQMLETNGAQTEEQKIAAMFRQGADQWEQQQEVMANAKPVYRGPPNQGKNSNVPDKPLPPGYICYRCGEKGHYIQSCPTNNDPDWEKRPRIKRTTGIPKSFLKTIGKPTTMANDGTVDDTKQPSGVMVTADGEWVIAEPDKASWDQYQAKAKVSAAAQEAAVRGSKELREKGLECSIDNRLFVDPTKTPCCQMTYCSECITNSLLENDLICPSCSTENILIDDLIPDEETSTKIRDYEKEKASLEADKEGSKSPNTKQHPVIRKEISENGSPVSRKSPVQNSTVEVTTPVLGMSAESKGKKRPAELELKNDRTPPGPPAPKMAKQSSNDGNKKAVSALNAEIAASMPNNPQVPFSNGNHMMPQGMNSMAFPNVNGFMGMPMPMNGGFFNPMMDPAAFMNGAGSDWNTIWAQTFSQQPMAMSGPPFQNCTYPTAGYNQNSMHMPMNNGYNGMNRMGGQGHGRGHFPNQQRNHFNGQNANDEDSAYFRKPVNPHRHQGRRNVNRPADYREI